MPTVESSLALLTPNVLRGVVETFDTTDALVLSNKIRKSPWPYPTAEWDVVKGSRNIATPNVPNSEAHIVPRLGVSRQAASFIYLREKKVFEPTTLHWLRQPGTVSNLARAEDAVLREVKDLNNRFDNFVEWALWQAVQGQITLDYNDVQATINTQIPNSHKPTASTSWASATAEQITGDIKAWKRLIQRDGRVAATSAYVTESTLDRVFRAFAGGSNNLLSDTMKDRYYRDGVLPGFQGLDWTIVDSWFEGPNGLTQFIADDTLVIGNFDDNTPIELLEGPSADDDAPEGHTGKFSKTWKELDPSARQFLLEYSFVPALTRPEQFVVVSDVAPGS